MRRPWRGLFPLRRPVAGLRFVEKAGCGLASRWEDRGRIRIPLEKACSPLKRPGRGLYLLRRPVMGLRSVEKAGCGPASRWEGRGRARIPLGRPKGPGLLPVGKAGAAACVPFAKVQVRPACFPLGRADCGLASHWEGREGLICFPLGRPRRGLFLLRRPVVGLCSVEKAGCGPASLWEGRGRIRIPLGKACSPLKRPDAGLLPVGKSRAGLNSAGKAERARFASRWEGRGAGPFPFLKAGGAFFPRPWAGGGRAASTSFDKRGLWR